MAKDMKDEFKDYVKELTESISREIFLEDLKNICSQCDVQLSTYKQLMDTTKEVNESLQNYTGSSEKKLQELSERVSSQMKAIHAVVSGITEEYKAVLKDFNAETNKLNEAEKEKLIEGLNGRMEVLGVQLSKKIQEDSALVFARFLRELQILCKENSGYYKVFKPLVEDAEKVHEDYVNQTARNMEIVKSLSDNVDEQLEKVNATIKGISEESRKIFQKYSREVSVLNERERELFLSDFASLFAKQIPVFLDLQKDSKANMDALRSLRKEMAYSTKEIQEALSFLRDGYREKVEQYLNEISEENVENRESLKNTVKEYTETLVSEFEKQMAAQKELTERLYESERQMVNQIKNEQANIIVDMKAELAVARKAYAEQQNALEIRLQNLMEENNRLEEKLKERSAWKTYMSVTNTMMILMLIVLAVMLRPWEIFGMRESIILGAGVLAGSLIIMIRKKIARLFVKKKAMD